jgi:hypothetical protein
MKNFFVGLILLFIVGMGTTAFAVEPDSDKDRIEVKMDSEVAVKAVNSSEYSFEIRDLEMQRAGLRDSLSITSESSISLYEGLRNRDLYKIEDYNKYNTIRNRYNKYLTKNREVKIRYPMVDRPIVYRPKVV